MALRIRKVKGKIKVLCAASHKAESGDIYLDDAVHYALSELFDKQRIKSKKGGV